MREDILRPIANGDETKSRLAVEPLDTAGKTIGGHYTDKRDFYLYRFTYNIIFAITIEQ